MSASVSLDGIGTMLVYAVGEGLHLSCAMHGRTRVAHVAVQHCTLAVRTGRLPTSRCFTPFAFHQRLSHLAHLQTHTHRNHMHTSPVYKNTYGRRVLALHQLADLVVLLLQLIDAPLPVCVVRSQFRLLLLSDLQRG